MYLWVLYPASEARAEQALGAKNIYLPVWWRRAVLPALPCVLCFLSFFLRIPPLGFLYLFVSLLGALTRAKIILRARPLTAGRLARLAQQQQEFHNKTPSHGTGTGLARTGSLTLT